MKRGLILVAALVLIWMSCGEKMTEEQLYAQALDFQEKQQWEELSDAYVKLVKTYPKSPKADEHMYNLGMVYANNVKEYNKAITTWEKLLKNYPDSRLVVNTKFMIGYTYANYLGDLDKARESYEAFIAEYPEHELVPSVKWELNHLGEDISDIELQLGEEELQDVEESLEASAN